MVLYRRFTSRRSTNKKGSNYEAYSEDALRIGKCLGIDIKTCNISDSPDAIPFICFPVYDLDKPILSKQDLDIIEKQIKYINDIKSRKSWKQKLENTNNEKSKNLL